MKVKGSLRMSLLTVSSRWRCSSAQTEVQQHWLIHFSFSVCVCVPSAWRKVRLLPSAASCPETDRSGPTETCRTTGTAWYSTPCLNSNPNQTKNTHLCRGLLSTAVSKSIVSPLWATKTAHKINLLTSRCAPEEVVMATEAKDSRFKLNPWTESSWRCLYEQLLAAPCLFVLSCKPKTSSEVSFYPVNQP